MDKVLGKKNMKKVSPAAWHSVACNQNIAGITAASVGMFWVHATLRHAAGPTFFMFLFPST